jgi:hypothetical protein
LTPELFSNSQRRMTLHNRAIHHHTAHKPSQVMPARYQAGRMLWAGLWWALPAIGRDAQGYGVSRTLR